MPPKRFFKRKTPYGADSGSGTGNAGADSPQIQFDLGVEKKKVTVRKFKNMKLIDIREYYQKEGLWMPGSKGISLTEEQWNALVNRMVDISEALHKIDDKEQLDVMKVAFETKNIAMKEQTREQSAGAGAGAAAEEEEDEDVDDVEFEDVSEAPDAKRVKTE